MDELNTAPSAVADERTAALSELIASTADEYETPSARITGDKDRENPVEGAPLAGLADELERLLAKATPGPWKATGLPYDGYTAPEITGSNGQYVAQTVYDMQSYTERDEVEADTELIVWLRNHADQLLTALRAERGDGWRTMDSAPRDGTVIWLTSTSPLWKYPFPALWDSAQNWWIFADWPLNDIWSVSDLVDRWRPLPPPPAALKQEGQSDG